MKRAVAYLLTGFLLAGFGVRAEDYVLPVGQTDVISTNVTYSTMTVIGDLTVSDGAQIKVAKVLMTNGTVMVTGSGTKMGSAHSTDDSTTWQLYPDEAGNYGKITVKDCRAWGDGPGAKWLYLMAENEAAKNGSGYIDFLRLENGGMPMRRTFNQSSLTGRVTVAGRGGSIYREGKRTSADGAIFALGGDGYGNGGYRIEMDDGADLLIHVSNQGGRLNDAGCSVEFVGNADIELNGGVNTSYPFALNRGAAFNHTGSLTFTRCGNYDCSFDLNGDVFGANVTNIFQTVGSASYDTFVRIAAGVSVTVNDLTLTGTRTRLLGRGDGARVKVNAATRDRTFKARIVAGDPLVVEKTGTYEMTVAAPTTNFSHLVVNEGTVRVTTDCVIEDLKMAEGALLVADGCRVVVIADGENLTQAFRSCNGGEIVVASSGRTMHYDFGGMAGALRFSGGTNVFSRYGLEQKWWRWTFTDVVNGPYPLRMRGLYLFGADGSLQNKELSQSGTADETTTSVLASGEYRLRCHSSTNLTHSADAKSYQKIYYSHNWFHVKSNGNNYFRAGSPVIDPENPVSHVGLEMCLSADAGPVVGYNIRKVHENGTGAPRSWTVEASDDGKVWSVVDRQEDVSVPSVDNTAYYTYDGTPYVNDSYNATELFHFTGYRRDGLTPMTEPLALQVDGGAVVDLRAFTGGQTVDALTVDCAAGTGEIVGAKLAAAGTVTLENAGVFSAGAVLPLTLPETLDRGNLATWTVVSGGKVLSLRAVVSADGTVRLVSVGTVLILR